VFLLPSLLAGPLFFAQLQKLFLSIFFHPSIEEEIFIILLYPINDRNPPLFFLQERKAFMHVQPPRVLNYTLFLFQNTILVFKRLSLITNKLYKVNLQAEVSTDDNFSNGQLPTITGSSDMKLETAKGSKHCD